MTDTTQLPAQTLAIIEMLQAAEVQEGVTVFDHSPEEIGMEVMENHHAILAALTRRAGGDAIPAGMKPWHGGIFPPEDWDGGKVLLADGDYEGADTLYQDSHDTGSNQWHHRRPGGIGCDIVAYTPKPPAGGDAGAVGGHSASVAIVRIGRPTTLIAIRGNGGPRVLIMRDCATLCGTPNASWIVPPSRSPRRWWRGSAGGM